jgi:hypothetical protein
MTPTATPPAEWDALAQFLTAGGVGSLSPGHALAMIRVRDAALALLARSPDAFPERAILVRYIQALHDVAMCSVHHQAEVIQTLERLVEQARREDGQ